jgi:hypothetical protein
MKRILLTLAFSALFATGAVAADITTQSPQTLIDSLTAIDGPVIGADGMSIYDGFIGDPRTLSPNTGVIGARPAGIPPAMRELVRRGAAVLPDLIAHLGDARPTKLVLGASSAHFFYMFRYFSNEYQARQTDGRLTCFLKCQEKSFDGAYRVRVADICYALIGQIVGRFLNAVRYQPTAGLIVNSPLEAPDLIAWVRRDWQGTTAESFRIYLVNDIQTASNLRRATAALQRLRFYYPAAYAALTGAGRGWREQFEARERAAR